MKDFVALAKNRKTTYDFSDRKLSSKDVANVLEAARWAPSCTNSQPWHFVVVSDEKQIRKLMSAANYGNFHAEPSLIIAIVLRQNLCVGEGYVCFRGKGSSVHDSYMSCGIAASHMTLAATDLGINSCILTPEQKKVKEILRVSKADAVPLLVGFGYEKKGAYQKKRERREIKESVSYEYFLGKPNKQSK